MDVRENVQQLRVLQARRSLRLRPGSKLGLPYLHHLPLSWPLTISWGFSLPPEQPQSSCLPRVYTLLGVACPGWVTVDVAGGPSWDSVSHLWGGSQRENFMGSISLNKCSLPEQGERVFKNNFSKKADNKELLGAPVGVP